MLALSRVRSAATAGEKATLVRRALVPSPAKVRYMAGTPSLASGYRRYWRGLVVSIGPALRHIVRHQDARGHRGRRVRAVRRVLTSDPWLLLEAGLCLGGARLAISILPFRWMTWALRQRQGEARVPAEGDTSPQRQRVALALQRVSHRTPGGSHCLAQALAGKQMLRRRGIGSTLHIGVAKEVQTHLEAHAWLRCGDLTVTGGDGLERFAVIATFSDRCTGVTGVTRR
ncbi:MAG: lasso peptide biosynthesis B2 protein [Acidimicrobiales bacterium]